MTISQINTAFLKNSPLVIKLMVLFFKSSQNFKYETFKEGSDVIEVITITNCPGCEKNHQLTLANGKIRGDVSNEFLDYLK